MSVVGRADQIITSPEYMLMIECLLFAPGTTCSQSMAFPILSRFGIRATGRVAVG